MRGVFTGALHPLHDGFGWLYVVDRPVLRLDHEHQFREARALNEHFQQFRPQLQLVARFPAFPMCDVFLVGVHQNCAFVAILAVLCLAHHFLEKGGGFRLEVGIADLILNLSADFGGQTGGGHRAGQSVDDALTGQVGRNLQRDQRKEFDRVVSPPSHALFRGLGELGQRLNHGND